jgi:hypothetical protein
LGNFQIQNLMGALQAGSYSIHVNLDSFGNAQAHGTVHIPEGTAPQVLIAQPQGTRASCADTDGDGIAGLTSLELLVRNVRSGELVPVVVVPDRGEIDEPGWHAITVRISNRVIAGRARVSLPGQVPRPPSLVQPR